MNISANSVSFGNGKIPRRKVIEVLSNGNLHQISLLYSEVLQHPPRRCVRYACGRMGDGTMNYHFQSENLPQLRVCIRSLHGTNRRYHVG